MKKQTSDITEADIQKAIKYLETNKGKEEATRENAIKLLQGMQITAHMIAHDKVDGNSNDLLKVKLNINDEFSPLKSVVVTEGTNIPYYDDYKTDDPEFIKFHPFSWDRDLLVEQQKRFLDKLSSYGVELIIPAQPSNVIWQMYTRDAGFVVGDKLFFSRKRKLQARNGEVEILFETLNLDSNQLVEIEGDIEGGDVLVQSKGSMFVGKTSRTSDSSILQLQKYADVKTLDLGSNVMHLDTRMTLLPKKILLITRSAFKPEDVTEFEKEYKLIDVTEEEATKLGTNVFIVNPETIFVPLQHSRIGDLLKEKGFNIEFIDYTESINLGGSFRCTTMPIERE